MSASVLRAEYVRKVCAMHNDDRAKEIQQLLLDLMDILEQGPLEEPLIGAYRLFHQHVEKLRDDGDL